MPRPRTAAVEQCFLCGGPVSEQSKTKEHFIPRGFYEGRRIPDEAGLCLPAHYECNRSTSDDDQWMSTLLPLSNPLGGKNQERWDRSIRTLMRPQAARFKERFVSGLVGLPGGDAVITVDADRVTWVLAKIVKGLCWRECRTFLGPETEWTARKGDFMGLLFPEHEPQWVVEVPSKGDISTRGSILMAKGIGAPDRGLFAWHLMIHGQHPFAVFTLPKAFLEPRAADGPHECMKLTWPKLRPRKVLEE